MAAGHSWPMVAIPKLSVKVRFRCEAVIHQQKLNDGLGRIADGGISVSIGSDGD